MDTLEKMIGMAKQKNEKDLVAWFKGKSLGPHVPGRVSPLKKSAARGLMVKQNSD